MNSYYKGIFAENLAKILLLLKGYKIIDKRFKSRLGEVDIICLKKGVMIFVEVKQRRDKLQFFDIINAKQKNRIIKASQVFLKKNNLHDVQMRFDVIFITLPFYIKHIKNAFWAD